MRTINRAKWGKIKAAKAKVAASHGSSSGSVKDLRERVDVLEEVLGIVEPAK